MKATLVGFALSAASCFGAAIRLPGDSLTVSALSTAGTSFAYSGTLTQDDTLGLTETGLACLQFGPLYCTNGAGVAVTAGTIRTGDAAIFFGAFNGTSSAWTYGALLLEISGAGAVQLFSSTFANGLGSVSPRQTLTINDTSLSSLGFGSFSVVDPTITFVLTDFEGYTDNSGGFLLQQGALAEVPEPSTFALFAVGYGMLALTRRYAHRYRYAHR